MKNWFGRESHPSDEYVDALRAAYDLIYNSDPKILAAYELLIEAQHHIDSMEESDRAAGEDL